MVSASVTAFHAALALHVAAVLVTFGAVLVGPIVLAVAARREPRSLPVLHRIEHTVERMLVFPGLLAVLVTGVYVAQWLNEWSVFFVLWGIGVSALAAVALAAVTIPTAKRAEAVAARDLRASFEGTVAFSEEYRALARRLSTVGSCLGALVLVTILLMGVSAHL